MGADEGVRQLTGETSEGDVLTAHDAAQVVSTDAGPGSLRLLGVSAQEEDECVTRQRTLLTEIERDLLDGKPLADLLRKAVILGGRAHSTELREWASQELNGYGNVDADNLPPYRFVAAPLRMDVIFGYQQVTGYSIGRSNLPPSVREHISERMALWQGVGELEAVTAQGQSVRFQLPGADLLRAEMDREVGEEFQQITSLYWAVPVPTIAGALDRIRTTLAELLSEIVSVMPEGANEPTAAQADHAVSLVIYGKGNRINLTTAQSSGRGIATAAPQGEKKSTWWTRWGRVGAILVGIATIVTAIPVVYAYFN